jgi:hypothetical protein
MDDIFTSLNGTISIMANITQTIMINTITSTLSSEQLDDLEYMSHLFCNDHGNYLNQTCDCDLAFFGQWCSEPGINQWSHGWTAFQVLLGMFYIILSLLTFYNLKKNIEKNTVGFGK